MSALRGVQRHVGVDDIVVSAASAEHADGARGEVERLTGSA
ncbi:MAG TPA: hypothetical protein PKA93_11085 [Arachnia sp.]|nr:hypothetical protein [Arachnia sp.]